MRSIRFLTEKSLYCLIILFLPTQLGRHFWFSFSFVQGIKVDYLSPTLYATDVLMVLLFIFFLLNVLKNKPKQLSKKKLLRWQVVLGVMVLPVGVIFAQNRLIAVYGLVKLLEFLFFGFYTARFVSEKAVSGAINKLAVLFSFGILFEGILSLLQFTNQRSVGGVLYYFGERMFDGQTPGIANASVNGALLLRPYGTFPHPNVLAGYMLIGGFILLAAIKLQHFKNNWLYIPILVLATVVIFFTLSRVVIVLWLMSLGYLAVRRFFKKITLWDRLAIVLLVLSVVSLVVIFPQLEQRFLSTGLSDESFLVRKTLISAAINVFAGHPLLGVGTGNFIPGSVSYLRQSLIINYLQPVHNIYLLVLTENGLVLFLLFLWFLWSTIGRVNKAWRKEKMRDILLLLLGSVLAIGLFDHYFMTLQQGQLLFALVLGICWANAKARV